MAAQDEQRPSEPAQNSRLLSAEQACPRTTYVREVASQVLTTALMGIGLRRRIASSASARASFLFDSAGLPNRYVLAAGSVGLTVGTLLGAAAGPDSLTLLGGVSIAGTTTSVRQYPSG